MAAHNVDTTSVVFRFLRDKNLRHPLDKKGEMSSVCSDDVFQSFTRVNRLNKAARKAYDCY